MSPPKQTEAALVAIVPALATGVTVTLIEAVSWEQVPFVILALYQVFAISAPVFNVEFVAKATAVHAVPLIDLDQEITPVVELSAKVKSVEIPEQTVISPFEIIPAWTGWSTVTVTGATV